MSVEDISKLVTFAAMPVLPNKDLGIIRTKTISPDCTKICLS